MQFLHFGLGLGLGLGLGSGLGLRVVKATIDVGPGQVRPDGSRATLYEKLACPSMTNRLTSR